MVAMGSWRDRFDRWLDGNGPRQSNGRHAFVFGLILPVLVAAVLIGIITLFKPAEKHYVANDIPLVTLPWEEDVAEERVVDVPDRTPLSVLDFEDADDDSCRVATVPLGYAGRSRVREIAELWADTIDETSLLWVVVALAALGFVLVAWMVVTLLLWPFVSIKWSNRRIRAEARKMEREADGARFVVHRIGFDGGGLVDKVSEETKMEDRKADVEGKGADVDPNDLFDFEGADGDVLETVLDKPVECPKEEASGEARGEDPEQKLERLGGFVERMKAEIEKVDVEDDQAGEMRAKETLLVNSLLNERAKAAFCTFFGSLPMDEMFVMLALAESFQDMGPCEDNKDVIPDFGKYVGVVSSLLDKGYVVYSAQADKDAVDVKHNLIPVISVQVAKMLFGGHADEVGFQRCFFKYGSTVEPSTIRPRELFYSENVQQDVDLFVRSLDKEHFTNVTRRMKHRGRPQALSCLLYGPSGTGKTELALQAARRSGRMIFRADLSKLTGSYYSEIQHNFRNIFLVYRYAAALMDTVPILMLNEADGLMGRRTDVTHAHDKYGNELQVVLLEEMESFEGILIATTNRNKDIDEAFERRFFMMINIGEPDQKARLQIWKDRLPEVDETVLEKLAKGYRLTGAAIELVVSRYDMIETLEDRTPTAEDLEELCRKAETKIIGRARNSAGYRTE